MLPTPDPTHYPILAAMLAPALLMAATGSLLISANNRLARVVDRLRATIALRRDCGDAAVLAALDTQIAQSRRRSHYVLRACLLFYLALGAFVATSLALAIDALAGFALGQVPAGFAVLGVIALLFGSLAMGLEVHLAVNGLNAELELSLRRDGSDRAQTPGD